MTIKQLKALIADLPDATPVLVAGRDHEYRDDDIAVGTVLESTTGFLNSTCWTEDFGEDESPGIKRVRALLIGTP